MQNNNGLNKGEWSELYTFLHLLKEPNLIIIDENLNVLDKKIFKIIDILLSDKKYHIDSSEIIKETNNNCLIKKYPIEYISKNAEILLSKIINHTKSKGSFKINELAPLIDDLLDGKKPKGHSFIKGDLNANVFDSKISSIKNISYNIKSNLGSKATLLNASNNTNFIFRVDNIGDQIMKDNNSINTKTKLLDRCSFLYKNGAEIKFIKTESEAFGYNLSLIDSNLHKILADMLLLSYKKNEKDIKKLLDIVSNNADENLFYRKKMSDFANAVTFGMRKQLQAEHGKADLENKIEELEARKIKLENKVTELKSKIDAIETRNKERKEIEQKKRDQEIDFLKYQENHLAKFLKTLTDQK